jgi:hypothetical protein
MEQAELGFLKSDPDAVSTCTSVNFYQFSTCSILKCPQLLMRFVDDFLCISTKQSTVERFTTAMHKGIDFFYSSTAVHVVY